MKNPIKEKPLTEEEIDEIVIAQVHDDDAWEEPFEVTPISRPRVIHRVIRATNPPAKNPAARPRHR